MPRTLHRQRLLVGVSGKKGYHLSGLIGNIQGSEVRVCQNYGYQGFPIKDVSGGCGDLLPSPELVWEFPISRGTKLCWGIRVIRYYSMFRSPYVGTLPYGTLDAPTTQVKQLMYASVWGFMLTRGGRF